MCFGNLNEDISLEVKNDKHVVKYDVYLDICACGVHLCNNICISEIPVILQTPSSGLRHRYGRTIHNLAHSKTLHDYVASFPKQSLRCRGSHGVAKGPWSLQQPVHAAGEPKLL